MPPDCRKTHLKFKIFRESMPPDPPSMACLRHATCLRHVSPKFRPPTYKYLPTPMVWPTSSWNGVDFLSSALVLGIAVQDMPVLVHLLQFWKGLCRLCRQSQPLPLTCGRQPVAVLTTSHGAIVVVRDVTLSHTLRTPWSWQKILCGSNSTTAFGVYLSQCNSHNVQEACRIKLPRNSIKRSVMGYETAGYVEPRLPELMLP